MDTSLAPVDIAQHLPFVDRYLIRTPPAMRRALWLVAIGQVENEGDPCPVRARALAEGGTPGEAGRISVVLNELEERGVLVRYRGRGRRPHLWSFRPRLEYWQGFHWGEAPRDVCEAVSGCFCRAGDNFVARFPGQSVAAIRRRARFELLPRDHIDPPGLLPVETRVEIMSRAPSFGPPGALPVETRDNGWGQPASPAALSYLPENSENSPLGEEEESYALLVQLLEFHSQPGDSVQAGTEPHRHLLEISRMLPLGQVKALRRHMDGVWSQPGGRVRVPSGARDLRRVAEGFLPKVAAAL